LTCSSNGAQVKAALFDSQTNRGKGKGEGGKWWTNTTGVTHVSYVSSVVRRLENTSFKLGLQTHLWGGFGCFFILSSFGLCGMRRMREGAGTQSLARERDSQGGLIWGIEMHLGAARGSLCLCEGDWRVAVLMETE